MPLTLSMFNEGDQVRVTLRKGDQTLGETSVEGTITQVYGNALMIKAKRPLRITPNLALSLVLALQDEDDENVWWVYEDVEVEITLAGQQA